MSNAVATVQDRNLAGIESALVQNDLSKMTTPERISYVKSLCDSVGLNHLSNPFAYITLQGKLTLYATKNASEQLRKIHGVSTQIVSQGIVDDCYEVQVKAQDKSGRQDMDFASIPIGNAKGADLANLKMKAVTKAKRRVTLSICGLGILDESEIETVRNVELADNPHIVNPLTVNEPPELPSENLPEYYADEFAQSDLGDYVIQFGKKHFGKKLSDLSGPELDGYLKWMKADCEKRGQQMTGNALEFYEKAEAYLCSLEFTSESPR